MDMLDTGGAKPLALAAEGIYTCTAWHEGGANPKWNSSVHPTHCINCGQSHAIERIGWVGDHAPQS